MTLLVLILLTVNRYQPGVTEYRHEDSASAFFSHAGGTLYQA